MCELKSSIKLKSNIIDKKERYDELIPYLPIEALPPFYQDKRNERSWSPEQEQQIIKRMFYAKETRDEKVRFSEDPKNAELCENCEYRDICF